jgi:hypothetical protein
MQRIEIFDQELVRVFVVMGAGFSLFPALGAPPDSTDAWKPQSPD